MPFVSAGPNVFNAVAKMFERPCDTCDAARDGRCYAAAGRQPIVHEFSADGIWTAHITVADAGTVLPQHSHSFDHLTLLAAGSVRVSRADTDPIEYSAPAGILIPAGVKHLFETLTPDVVLACIHNTARTGRVQVADEHQIVETV